MLWVNLAGGLLILLTIWWFWLYKPKETQADETDKAVTITVDAGVYQPSNIRAQANRPITLSFLRKDDSPCAETVIFPELEISETLPVNQTKTISLPTLHAGTYQFHCQMQMYRGTLHVE